MITLPFMAEQAAFWLQHRAYPELTGSFIPYQIYVSTYSRDAARWFCQLAGDGDLKIDHLRQMAVFS